MRRRYKAVLTVTFIITSGLYIIVDVIFQVSLAQQNLPYFDQPLNFLDPECRHLQLPHLSPHWGSFRGGNNNFSGNFSTSSPHSWQSQPTRPTSPPPSIFSSSLSRSSTPVFSSTQSSAQSEQLVLLYIYWIIRAPYLWTQGFSSSSVSLKSAQSKSGDWPTPKT